MLPFSSVIYDFMWLTCRICYISTHMLFSGSPFSALSVGLLTHQKLGGGAHTWKSNETGTMECKRKEDGNDPERSASAQGKTEGSNGIIRASPYAESDRALHRPGRPQNGDARKPLKCHGQGRAPEGTGGEEGRGPIGCDAGGKDGGRARSVWNPIGTPQREELTAKGGGAWNAMRMASAKAGRRLTMQAKPGHEEGNWERKHARKLIMKATSSKELV